MGFFGIILVALGAAAITAGLVFAGMLALKKQISSAVGAERDSFTREIPQLIQEAESLIGSADKFASKPQLDFVASQSKETQAELEKEKDNLKSIETRLDQAQKDVEQKEAAQQEIKTANEEEELKIQDLMGKFETLSTDSMGLEQRLANSMKNLDRLMEEVELTPDQRGALTDLSNALTQAGSQLRDLLMEYTTVKERIGALKQQHRDLEEET